MHACVCVREEGEKMKGCTGAIGGNIALGFLFFSYLAVKADWMLVKHTKPIAFARCRTMFSMSPKRAKWAATLSSLLLAERFCTQRIREAFGKHKRGQDGVRYGQVDVQKRMVFGAGARQDSLTLLLTIASLICAGMSVAFAQLTLTSRPCNLNGVDCALSKKARAQASSTKFRKQQNLDI